MHTTANEEQLMPESQMHATANEEQLMPEGHVTIEDTNSTVNQPSDRGTREAISIEAEIRAMRRLAVEIAAAWVSPKSGVELVDEQRR